MDEEEKMTESNKKNIVNLPKVTHKTTKYNHFSMKVTQFSVFKLKPITKKS